MKIKNLTPETHHEIPISAKLMNIRHYSSHMHKDSLELLYCISGNLNLVSAHMDYLQLHENELLLLDRNDIHYAWADDDNKILVVHIGLADYSLYAERVKYLFFSCAHLTTEYKIMQAKDQSFHSSSSSSSELFRNSFRLPVSA